MNFIYLVVEIKKLNESISINLINMYITSCFDIFNLNMSLNDLVYFGANDLINKYTDNLEYTNNFNYKKQFTLNYGAKLKIFKSEYNLSSYLSTYQDFLTHYNLDYNLNKCFGGYIYKDHFKTSTFLFNNDLSCINLLRFNFKENFLRPLNTKSYIYLHSFEFFNTSELFEWANKERQYSFKSYLVIFDKLWHERVNEPEFAKLNTKYFVDWFSENSIKYPEIFEKEFYMKIRCDEESGFLPNIPNVYNSSYFEFETFYCLRESLILDYWLHLRLYLKYFQPMNSISTYIDFFFCNRVFKFDKIYPNITQLGFNLPNKNINYFNPFLIKQNILEDSTNQLFIKANNNKFFTFVPRNTEYQKSEFDNFKTFTQTIEEKSKEFIKWSFYPDYSFMNTTWDDHINYDDVKYEENSTIKLLTKHPFMFNLINLLKIIKLYDIEVIEEIIPTLWKSRQLRFEKLYTEMSNILINVSLETYSKYFHVDLKKYNSVEAVQKSMFWNPWRDITFNVNNLTSEEKQAYSSFLNNFCLRNSEQENKIFRVLFFINLFILYEKYYMVWLMQNNQLSTYIFLEHVVRVTIDAKLHVLLNLFKQPEDLNFLDFNAEFTLANIEEYFLKIYKNKKSFLTDKNCQFSIHSYPRWYESYKILMATNSLESLIFNYGTVNKNNPTLHNFIFWSTTNIYHLYHDVFNNIISSNLIFSGLGFQKPLVNNLTKFLFYVDFIHTMWYFQKQNNYDHFILFWNAFRIIEKNGSLMLSNNYDIETLINAWSYDISKHLHKSINESEFFKTSDVEKLIKRHSHYWNYKNINENWLNKHSIFDKYSQYNVDRDLLNFGNILFHKFDFINYKIWQLRSDIFAPNISEFTKGKINFIQNPLVYYDEHTMPILKDGIKYYIKISYSVDCKEIKKIEHGEEITYIEPYFTISIDITDVYGPINNNLIYCNKWVVDQHMWKKLGVDEDNTLNWYNKFIASIKCVYVPDENLFKNLTK